MFRFDDKLPIETVTNFVCISFLDYLGVILSRLRPLKHAMHKIAEKTTIKGIIQRFKKRKTELSFNTVSS